MEVHVHHCTTQSAHTSQSWRQITPLWTSWCIKHKLYMYFLLTRPKVNWIVISYMIKSWSTDCIWVHKYPWIDWWGLKIELAKGMVGIQKFVVCWWGNSASLRNAFFKVAKRRSRESTVLLYEKHLDLANSYQPQIYVMTIPEPWLAANQGVR